MSNVDVGQLLTGCEQRDAIHIAIAPVIAGMGLEPGSFVSFRDPENQDIVVSCAPALAVGIVDPFLQKPVRPGDRFYMFLNPNTITSLRHEWTHPAFNEAEYKSLDIAKSETWLRNFCMTHDAPDYDDLLKALQNGGEYDAKDGYTYIRIDNGYIYVGGQDAHGEIPNEFWDHAEIVSGKKFSERPTHFSCSC